MFYEIFENIVDLNERAEEVGIADEAYGGWFYDWEDIYAAYDDCDAKEVIEMILYGDVDCHDDVVRFDAMGRMIGYTWEEASDFVEYYAA